jgi:DNA-directed RNA polymerase specialized sigma24 family protein
MCGLEQPSVASQGVFASSSDFCRIFTRQLKSLYRIAFLLTTNHSYAEQCTLASLDEALNVDGIPRSSAESWIKRIIIKNALRMMRSESPHCEMPEPLLNGTTDEFTEWPFNAIIRLHPLERVVFVLSVLEKIAEDECSRLSGCAISEIGPARVRALELLSKLDASEKEKVTDRRLSTLLLRGERALTNLRRKARKKMSRTGGLHAIAAKMQPKQFPNALEGRHQC